MMSLPCCKSDVMPRYCNKILCTKVATVLVVLGFLLCELTMAHDCIDKHPAICRLLKRSGLCNDPMWINTTETDCRASCQSCEGFVPPSSILACLYGGIDGDQGTLRGACPTASTVHCQRVNFTDYTSECLPITLEGLEKFFWQIHLGSHEIDETYFTAVQWDTFVDSKCTDPVQAENNVGLETIGQCGGFLSLPATLNAAAFFEHCDPVTDGAHSLTCTSETTLSCDHWVLQNEESCTSTTHCQWHGPDSVCYHPTDRHLCGGASVPECDEEWCAFDPYTNTCGDIEPCQCTSNGKSGSIPVPTGCLSDQNETSSGSICYLAGGESAIGACRCARRSIQYQGATFIPCLDAASMCPTIVLEAPFEFPEEGVVPDFDPQFNGTFALQSTAPHHLDCQPILSYAVAGAAGFDKRSLISTTGFVQHDLGVSMWTDPWQGVYDTWFLTNYTSRNSLSRNTPSLSYAPDQVKATLQLTPGVIYPDQGVVQDWMADDGDVVHAKFSCVEKWVCTTPRIQLLPLPGTRTFDFDMVSRFEELVKDLGFERSGFAPGDDDARMHTHRDWGDSVNHTIFKVDAAKFRLTIDHLPPLDLNVPTTSQSNTLVCRTRQPPESTTATEQRIQLGQVGPSFNVTIPLVPYSDTTCHIESASPTEDCIARKANTFVVLTAPTPPKVKVPDLYLVQLSEQAVDGSNCARAVWAPLPEGELHDAAANIKYEVQFLFQDAQQMKWTTAVVTAMTHADVCGMYPGTFLQVEVTPVNSVGTGLSNSAFQEFNDWELLVAPSIDPSTTIARARSVTLVWNFDTSASNRGSISGYLVSITDITEGDPESRRGVDEEIEDGATRSISLGPNVQEYTFSKLKPNTAYQLSVAALNGFGAGPENQWVVTTASSKAWIPAIWVILLLAIVIFVVVKARRSRLAAGRKYTAEVAKLRLHDPSVVVLEDEPFFTGKSWSLFDASICLPSTKSSPTPQEISCTCKVFEPEAMKFIGREVGMLLKLESSHVVEVFQFYHSKVAAAILFEPVRSTLIDFLRRHAPTASARSMVSHEQLTDILRQVDAGLSYIRRVHIVHKNIQGESILLDETGHAKICNFQSAFHEDELRAQEDPVPNNQRYRWMAPESILIEAFTPASDIFAFGVLCWEIFSYGLVPWGGYTDTDVIQAVKQGTVLECPVECPSLIYKFMLQCWAQMPSRRSSYQDYMQKLMAAKQTSSLAVNVPVEPIKRLTRDPVIDTPSARASMVSSVISPQSLSTARHSISSEHFSSGQSLVKISVGSIAEEYSTVASSQVTAGLHNVESEATAVDFTWSTNSAVNGQLSDPGLSSTKSSPRPSMTCDSQDSVSFV
eukprot:m.27277 g.27277  ORF g.27277 m.27277 type:complete len:1340 (+) comp8912_c1_seq2:350-4369(+)